MKPIVNFMATDLMINHIHFKFRIRNKRATTLDVSFLFYIITYNTGIFVHKINSMCVYSSIIVTINYHYRSNHSNYSATKIKKNKQPKNIY